LHFCMHMQLKVSHVFCEANHCTHNFSHREQYQLFIVLPPGIYLYFVHNRIIGIVCMCHEV